jgi:flagellin
MSRINTNVSSLIAQRVLRKNNDSLNQSLERLSTGLKINSGADNPAGLIASETLRSEKAGITQAIDNAGRASNIVGTAEGGLSEVSSLLTELQSLVGQSALRKRRTRISCRSIRFSTRSIESARRPRFRARSC